MKKIYLSAMVLSIASLSFGQGLTQRMAFGVGSEPTLNPKDQNINDKALGQVIWTDNFDTLTNWTIDNSTGPGGPAFGWTIDPNSDGWWSSTGINSTSGGNFAELSNGNPTANPATQALNVVYTLTLANPINLIALGGSQNVTLEFEQYGARFNDLQEIQISTDGTNFTTVGDNLDKSVLSSSGGSAYPNPDIKRINLSPFLTATTATSVWIRFRWTTDFPAQATNPNVWVAYGWYIDDLKISTLPDNNITTSVSNTFYGSQSVPYTRIPVAQIQPIDFIMKALNEGSVDQPNTKLTADINNGAFTVTSPPSTLLVGATDSLVTTQWTPPTTVGIPYIATLTVSSDSTDDFPADNSVTFPPFEISQFTYAQDDYGTPGNGGGAGPGGTTDVEFEAGNFYDAVVNDVATGIIVVVGTNAPVGTTIDGVLYSIDATGNFVEVSRSGFYTTTAADAGNAVTLLLNVTPGTMTAGTTYFAAVHTFTDFSYGTSGSSPGPNTIGGTTSLIFYGSMTNPVTNESFYTSSTPMIRLSDDPTLGLDNKVSENIKFSVYPTISSDIFHINLDANNAENVTLSVRNIVGQTVLTKQLTVNGSTRETISLANYDKGIYFLTIDGNKERKTVKLIVE